MRPRTRIQNKTKDVLQGEDPNQSDYSSDETYTPSSDCESDDESFVEPKTKQGVKCRPVRQAQIRLKNGKTRGKGSTSAGDKQPDERHLRLTPPELSPRKKARPEPN